MKTKLVVDLSEVGIDDVGLVGGKNASLGEMIRTLSEKGIRVPGGFAVTAEGYRLFMKENKLDGFVLKSLEGLNTSNLKDLARQALLIREAVRKAPMPKVLEDLIAKNYSEMESQCGANVDVAVRSSATAEDLPGASFAGEHETYLGIKGIAGV